jgi:hypothetical protein
MTTFARIVRTIVRTIGATSGLVALAAAARAQDVVIRPHPSGGVEVALPTAADGSRVLPWGIEQVQAMRPGQLLSIRGVIGKVRITRSTIAGMATLRVTRADGEPAPRVVVVPSPSGVTVCAVHPSPNPKKPNECRPDGKARLINGAERDWPAVAFEVGVPDAVNYSVNLIDGDIRADAAPGTRVTLNTHKGRIAVVDYGAASLQADSMVGDMELIVSALPLRTTRLLLLSVMKGTMDVRIPETTPVHYLITGHVRSDYPLTGPADFKEGTFGPDDDPYVRLQLSAGIMGRIEIRPPVPAAP